MFRPHLLQLASCLLLACSQNNPTADTDSGPPPVPADSLKPAADSPVAPAPDNSPTTATAPPAAPTAGGRISWPAPFRPAAVRPCEQVTPRAATIYQRPEAQAPVFGQLPAGETLRPVARTADGWLGFDPATAQAANVGIFRLRWVRAAEVFGANAPVCADLPVVQAPAYACLLMATHPVPVRLRPEAAAPPLGTIPVGSYARIRPQPAPAGWTAIEVPGQAQPGYVAEADVELNGPCR
ncbi:hypothetical protein LJ737_01605 [Hymenobacter sp. 15J16-1T3B]|uniref:hypothetical protein n=1 Tax=Hymenobacter sp. 15J16-1T3B TaxID=2886941 RepID=UPI001D111AB3|nr:hypothetical protein [Hymenobacter sp. 15J16-1T3B]MCC3155914.1 hypothetical protein [Hymenobacter sp. 15J16-1T3B]